MIRAVAIAASLFLLIGCASAPRNAWYRYGGSLEDARRDVADCRYEVVKYGRQDTARTGAGSGTDMVVGENSTMIQCMAHRRFRFISPDSIPRLEIGAATTKEQVEARLGPCAWNNGAGRCSLVVISPLDPGPLGMDWYSQSRMYAKYQEFLFSLSHGDIADKIRPKESNEIFPVR